MAIIDMLANWVFEFIKGIFLVMIGIQCAAILQSDKVFLDFLLRYTQADHLQGLYLLAFMWVFVSLIQCVWNKLDIILVALKFKSAVK